MKLIAAPLPAAAQDRSARPPDDFGPLERTGDSQGATASQSAGVREPVSSTAVSVLLLANFHRGHRLWGFSRLALGRTGLGVVPGLLFCRVLGSGRGGGFGLRPSMSHQGLFCTFVDPSAAAAFLRSPVVAAYRARSQDFLLAQLRACSSKGAWGGLAHPVSAPVPAAGMVAALTRASIRPMKALAFWRHAPPAEHDLQQAAGCTLAVGLGEAPVLRQATFSVWDSVGHMDAYARHGSHLAAIRAAYGEAYFAETMFVRFVVDRIEGRWQGRAYG